ncbi:MAG: histidinol-phosphatase [Planctomycetaceae bacterium]|nr:histidinol-phosphatase [Planctomycetaceae bacterium]
MSRLELAKRIAREAGELTLRYFYRADLAVDRKEDRTPVTAADRGAEELLRRRIEEAFPDDAILGEEFPVKAGTSGYRWILDPIDGTKSFIHGVPIYSTLIGVERERESLIGVIALPALGEMLWAEKGGGTWWESSRFAEPKRAQVSQKERLDESLFLTSEVISFDQYGRRDVYTQLERDALLTRTWGDAYGYYLVATGRAELMVDPKMSLWDAAPLQIIMEEAGGVFTDWKGNRTIFHEEGVASNGRFHEQVIELTRRFDKPRTRQNLPAPE